MKTLRFYVNDRLVEESDVPPTTTLLYYLRYNLGLTGTKEGCNEGDCGACTAVIVDPQAPGGPAFRAVNSCLVLLPMVQGKRVYSVEALASNGDYHPVQQALVDELGSQCGYCTPGFIMSMFEAYYRQDMDEDWKLDDQLAGNLCRCTGYRPIIDATKAIAGKGKADRFTELRDTANAEKMDLEYEQGEQRFFTPGTFEALFEVLEKNPDARFVAGGTDLSLEITKLFKEPPCLVSTEGIDELRRLEIRDDGALHIGATARLSDVEVISRNGWPTIEKMARFYGARQIKHRATVAGNLCTASPIGDMAPVLVSLGATVTLRSASGQREIPVEDFVVDYRKTALQPGEVLEYVTVPPIPDNARTGSYKVSKRQELDISTVSGGFMVALDDDGNVESARLAFGGMSARAGARARNAEKALIGQPWTEASVELAAAALKDDFAPIDDHRGSAWYRRVVAGNLLRGFQHETRNASFVRLPYRPVGTVQLEAKS